MGQTAATFPIVTSIFPGRCNNPTNLLIIATRIGTCHQETTDPQFPKINIMCPQGDPATQEDVNTVDLALKNISSAYVTATKRERVRESVYWGSQRAAMDVNSGLCVSHP